MIINIDAKTKVCGVIGYPLSHTLSPMLHNAALAAAKLNVVFLPLQVKDARTAIEAMHAFGFLAYAVTMPHKQAVLPYLDEIDKEAHSLGNVNTVVSRAGKLIGYNTDIIGVSKSLNGLALKDKSVLLIGAGGAALTCAYVLSKKKAKLFVMNIEEAAGRALALKYGADYVKEQELKGLNFDLVINATPVGMGTLRSKSPVPYSFLKKGMVVFDVVYNPIRTKLIREAERRGCAVITGDTMFISQAARQFELYTGKKAPVEVMKRAFKRSQNYAR
jgi:shikimate dehydrogenase